MSAVMVSMVVLIRTFSTFLPWMQYAVSFNFKLYLRTFVAEKLPDDGTVFPKHLRVGTWYEVCPVICFTVFKFVRFLVFKNMECKKMYVYLCLYNTVSCIRVCVFVCVCVRACVCVLACVCARAYGLLDPQVHFARMWDKLQSWNLSFLLSLMFNAP